MFHRFILTLLENGYMEHNSENELKMRWRE